MRRQFEDQLPLYPARFRPRLLRELLRSPYIYATPLPTECVGVPRRTGSNYCTTRVQRSLIIDNHHRVAAAPTSLALLYLIVWSASGTGPCLSIIDIARSAAVIGSRHGQPLGRHYLELGEAARWRTCQISRRVLAGLITRR